MKIVVASTNPVKCNAALAGFERMFPGKTFEVEGVSVGSGVSDQPLSDDETYTGAFNRAMNAKAAQPDADYWVGLEGGIETKGADMESFAWIVVVGKSDIVGRGKTGVLFLPPRVAELIHQGKELGEADDIVFQQTNSKQSNGAVGLLTGDVLTRESVYTEAVIFALIPHRNPQFYTAGS